MNTTIELPQLLSPHVFKQLEYKIRYHYPEVTKVGYAAHSPKLELFLTKNLEKLRAEEIHSSVRAMAKELQTVNRLFAHERVLFHHSPENIICAEGREKFAASVVSEGEGSVLYQGFALESITHVSNFIEKIFSHLATDSLRVPSTISLEELNRIHYIPSFHHHLCFIHHLDPEVKKLSAFSKAWQQEETRPASLNEYLASPTRALNPAVCLHVYPKIARQGFPVLTEIQRTRVVGKVFRFESGNHSDLERLFEFTMHEVVVVGSEELVLIEAQRFLALLKQLAYDLGLESKLVVANDMFIGEREQNRLFSQLSTQSKVEFLVRLSPENRFLAVASLNIHGQHFTEPLNIRIPKTGNLGASLCFGVGIERLALVLSCQKGDKSLSLLSSVDHLQIISKAEELWKLDHKSSKL